VVYKLMTATSAVTALSDHDLLAAVVCLAGRERGTTAELVAHLAELDARRLYLGAGFSSLFAYCTGVLRLSEHEAYNRIEAARAVRRFPVLLERLGDGSLNLTTIRLLSPHLQAENAMTLLAAASGKSRREVEELLACHFPRPFAAASVRKLPGARPAVGMLAPPTSTSTSDPQPSVGVLAPPTSTATSNPQTAMDGEARAAASSSPLLVLPDPAEVRRLASDTDRPASSPPATSHASPAQPASRRAQVTPLAPDMYKIAFTARAETRAKLQRAQDLLRHQIPNGDPAEIFDRALSALLDVLARKKVGASARPRPGGAPARGSRHVPAEVRRTVWRRDGGCCAFVAKSGRRCAERGFLEFHHEVPYAVGGEATIRNISLRCRAHNGYEAQIDFGPRNGRATRSEPSRTRARDASHPDGLEDRWQADGPPP
jgi:hypothetical protein